MLDNKRLVYRVTREHSQGYTIDHLWIGEYSEESAAKRLAGTVNNKDGYDASSLDKGAATAKRLGDCYTAMLRDGHEVFYDWCYSSHAFTIRFQVYENPDADRPNYCSPHFELPDSLKSAQWALKLVEKLGKRIERDDAKKQTAERGYEVAPGSVDDQTFRQLQDVTVALDKMGAARCEWWTGPSQGWHSPPKYMVPIKK